MEMYNDEFPTGDVGGNLITMPSYMGDKNLHAAWDHMMFSQHVSIKMPIPDDYWPTFCEDTDAMLARNIDVVSNPAFYENMNIDAWAQESYEYGITKYEGITVGEYVPDWYIEENLPLTEQRVVTAGYRLSWVI